MVTDETIVANELNNHFGSVFSKHNLVRAQRNYRSELHLPLETINITSHGVMRLLASIDPKKSPGPDNIPNVFLKNFKVPISKYFALIFNYSLRSCQIPNDWKCANVSPLFKSGSDSRLSVSNYRPISLTPQICKTLEHIVCREIISFVENNNLLTNVQHAYRRNFSTVTQLVELYHGLAVHYDKSIQVDAVFLDFSKAFDKVPHQKLLAKMALLGINIFIV